MHAFTDMKFLIYIGLLINSNFGRNSNRFRDIDA